MIKKNKLLKNVTHAHLALNGAKVLRLNLARLFFPKKSHIPLGSGLGAGADRFWCYGGSTTLARRLRAALARF
jgi:hypothetical protein